MSVLDYPLEAVALNYVSSIAFLNNLWPWLAVITAALSAWKIRDVRVTAATKCVNSSNDVKPLQQHACYDEDSKGCQTISKVLSHVGHVSAKVPRKQPLSSCVNSEVKGKFSIYYDDQENHYANKVEWNYSELVFNERDRVVERWEDAMRMRMGEMGWYDFQDMKVINGNVVKSWGGSSVRKRLSSRCIVH